MGDKGGKKSKSQQHLDQADVVKLEERARNLQRATTDVQKLLKEITLQKTEPRDSKKPQGNKNESASKKPHGSKTESAVSKKPGNKTESAASKKPGNKTESATSKKQYTKDKGSRGSNSMMNLSSSTDKKPKGNQGTFLSHQGSSGGGRFHHEYHGPASMGPRPPYCPPQNQSHGLFSYPGHCPPYSQGSQPSSSLQFQQSPPSFQQRPPSYQQPPPSYDESNRMHWKCGNRNISDAPSILEGLVKAITLFEGQWCTAENLSRQVQSSVKDIMKVVKYHKDMFSFMEGKDGVIIELVPKVSLCSNYLSEKGCLSRDSCKDLHLCREFVTGFCDAGASCQYGHRWDTDHNNSVLSKLHLDLIDKRTLHLLIKKISRRTASPQICSFYNSKSGCRYNDKCSHFHICKDYVKRGGKCFAGNCSFNHDHLTDHCKRLLKKYGISMNETPRDILLNLKSLTQNQEDKHLSSPAFSSVNTGIAESGQMKKPQKAEAAVSNQGNETSAKRGNKEKTKAKNSGAKIKETEKIEEDSSSDSESDSQSSEESDAKASSKDQKRNKKDRRGEERKKNASTVSSTDVCGDVQVPEICIYSVSDQCLNAKKGCKYLHAKSLFHWQFEKDGKWYNFRVFQSKALENAYRDISKSSVQLPPLEESKLATYAKELLEILGSKSWTADFQKMSLKSSSGALCLNIRRVSTRSSAVSESPKATVYEWYFVDEQDKCIRYGQADSLGKQEFVCNISCEDIEKQYLSDTSSSMLICNAHYKYKLDFAKMTQTNLITNKVREIRRRPSRLAYQKHSSPDSGQTSLPAYWIPMAGSQTHVLVPLNQSDKEYLEVVGRLRLMLPTANVLKVQRLQNPYLWTLLQHKKAELSQRYDENQMNFQKLFHGTDPSKMDTICKENIDWRQGTNVTQDFGKGTYFSNSAAVARGHCTVDEHGHYFIILADVIIGTVIKGAPTLTCAPINPSTGIAFDTTVDDVHAPTIFVKYDKVQYYPEYIVEFF